MAYSQHNSTTDNW